MSNIYLKVTIEKNWPSQNLDFLSLKICLQDSFKTSWCNLEIRGMGAILWVAFLLFYFWKELWPFKVKESMYLVEQKYKIW